MNKHGIAAILLLSLSVSFLAGCNSTNSSEHLEPVTDSSQNITSEDSQNIASDNSAAAPSPLVEQAAPTDNYDHYSYYVNYAGTPCYTAPTGVLADEITELELNTEVTYFDESGDYYQVYLPDNRLVWVDKWFLSACDDRLQQENEISELNRLISSPTFVPLEAESDYSVMCTALNVRAEPTTNCKIYCTLSFNDQVTVLGQDGDYYLCRFENGSFAYCSADYLTSEPMYALIDGGVDLRGYLPDAEFELLFASSNNITGSAMYPAVPLLELTTARMLKQAYEIFKADGYTLKIYDAYRPRSAQFKLWNAVQDVRFIANPNNGGGSWHNVGRAVDISLVNTETGEELEMPTPMHTFDAMASRSSRSQWSDEAKANVDYLASVMRSVGFGTLATEWWHFENTSTKGTSLDKEIDYSALQYVLASEYGNYVDINN